MKKFIVLLGVLCLALILVACGKSGDETAPAITVEDSPDSPEDNGGDAVIIYFSHTGNTQQVADYIRDYTGAEVIRLEASEAYPEDYEACYQRAVAEHAADARPALKTELVNLDSYDTVFLGWPCWDNSCPMLILTMLEQYDFSGKTILPFTTSGSSGFGQSLAEIGAVCPEADYQRGLALTTENLANSEAEVAQWLQASGFSADQTPATGAEDASPPADTGLVLEVGEQSFPVALSDKVAVKELLELLPLTITMNELNGKEKYYYLTHSLSTDSQAMATVAAGDLMLYGSDCLVLFYETFATSYNYTPLGHIEDTAGLGAALGGGNVAVTLRLGE